MNQNIPEMYEFSEISNTDESLSSNERINSNDMIAYNENEPVWQLDVEAVYDGLRNNLAPLPFNEEENSSKIPRKEISWTPPVMIEDPVTNMDGESDSAKWRLDLAAENMYDDFGSGLDSNERVSTFDRICKELNSEIDVDGSIRVGSFDIPLGNNHRWTSHDLVNEFCESDDGKEDEEMFEINSKESNGIILSKSFPDPPVQEVPDKSDAKMFLSTPPQSPRISPLISRPVTPLSPQNPPNSKTKFRKGNNKSIVLQYKDADVLFGRGGRSNHHPGNIRYREKAESMKEEYCHPRMTKAEKTAMSNDLVRFIKEAGGRFLKFDEVRKEWTEVDNKVARRKASQALREDKKINQIHGD